MLARKPSEPFDEIAMQHEAEEFQPPGAARAWRGPEPPPVASHVHAADMAPLRAGRGNLVRASRTAGGKFGATVRYFREETFQKLGTDLVALARRHPGQSILWSVVAGFLVGRILRR